jgi:hypothetical protein
MDVCMLESFHIKNVSISKKNYDLEKNRDSYKLFCNPLLYALCLT